MMGYCAVWQSACISFSQSVGCYVHNMIASGSINEVLQIAFLTNLGVNPWLQSSPWPLQVIL